MGEKPKITEKLDDFDRMGLISDGGRRSKYNPTSLDRAAKKKAELALDKGARAANAAALGGQEDNEAQFFGTETPYPFEASGKLVKVIIEHHLTDQFMALAMQVDPKLDPQNPRIDLLEAALSRVLINNRIDPDITVKPGQAIVVIGEGSNAKLRLDRGAVNTKRASAKTRDIRRS